MSLKHRTQQIQVLIILGPRCTPGQWTRRSGSGAGEGDVLRASHCRHSSPPPRCSPGRGHCEAREPCPFSAHCSRDLLPAQPQGTCLESWKMGPSRGWTGKPYMRRNLEAQNRLKYWRANRTKTKIKKSWNNSSLKSSFFLMKKLYEKYPP